MLIDQTDDDVVVWRYINFTKLVSMLHGDSLYFERPFTYDDQWEGLLPPSFHTNTKKYAKDHNIPFDDFSKDFRKRCKIRRYAHFVNCWHISHDESDAMWRLYGLSPEGVAIQSTKSSLTECLRPHDYGDVIYYDPNDNIKNGCIFGPSDILWKRKYFSWEHEFRIWFVDDVLLEKIESNEEVNEVDLSPGKLVQITNMATFIKRLVVAPGASDWFFNLVRDVCGIYKKKWLGNRVERSCTDRLYDSFIGSRRREY